MRTLSTAPLSRREDLGAGYQVLWFSVDHPLDALPGQFAMVRSVTWGEAPLLGRPMSLLTGGREPSILIKVVGQGTQRMADAPLGERFTLLAPLGTSWPPPGPGERPVLVAGGVGVAPLVFFAERLRAEGRRDLLSLYGGRSARDLPLSQRLEAAGELALSTEDGSRGTHGLVTALLARAIDEAKAKEQEIRLYACGPQGMMAAVAELAARHQVRCETSLEAPMACGYGVCLGCSVARADGGYLYTCVEGPCVDARTIDWTERVF